MKNLAVAGTGYVGLSCGTCFADMGNQVTLRYDWPMIPIIWRKGLMPF